MSHYGLIFLAGIAASWHCIGMCGGFACALSGAKCGKAAAQRQLLYNAGRVTTYCFLGALAAALTASICKANPAGVPIEAVQRILAVLSGVLIILIGAQFLGLLHRFQRSSIVGFGGEAFAKALHDLQRAQSPAAPLAFGAVNGLLPCPLVYGLLAQAAATGDVLPGMGIMAAFGLGTFPAMLITGGFGGWLRERMPAGAGMVAGTFFLVLGLVTLARGVFPMSGHGHLT